MRAQKERKVLAQRVFAISATGVGVSVDRDRQMVLVILDLPAQHTHLAEDLQVAIRLTASEARKLARTLTQKSYSAAAGPAQA